MLQVCFRKTHPFFEIVFAFILAHSLPLFGQTAPVPPDHWVYDFLDRLETRGLIVSEDFSMQPYAREAVAELLIRASAPANMKQLSGIEQRLLAQLRGEFREEILELGGLAAADSSSAERHLFSWLTEDVSAHFDGLLGEDIRLENKTPADTGIPKSTTYYGLRARVRLKKSLSIFVDARSYILSDTDSLTNTVFNPSHGLPVTEKALVDVATTDNVSSTIKVRLPWLDLEFGRDLVEWGPGYRGNLLISRNSNYYDLIKTTFRYKKAKLEYFHAFLNAEQSKYLVSHRLEFAPVQTLRIGISESVVYGGRAVEPLYLNPFAPIIISERHLGNKDNNMVAFDGTLYLKARQLKLYGEVLFDDFSFAKPIFSSWGNKWGILTGAYWVNPLGLANTDFRIEVVRIQPFVYSHREPQNTYSNYDNIIGHWLGPDADDLFMQLSRQLHKNLQLGLSFEYRRRAQNDINEGARPPDGRIKFLDGVVERNQYYGLHVRWQAIRDLFVTIDYHFIQSDNLHRVAGFGQHNNRVFLRAALNY